MRQINNGYRGIGGFGSNFAMCFGTVKDNADPQQHGRLKVFIPSIDSKDYDVTELPWALYCSPFGGTTANFVTGRDASQVSGASSYGFWAVPKNGAQVLIGFLEGDPNVRFWMGCFFQTELNRTMPQSINDPPISTEIDESGIYPQATIAHYAANLSEAGLGPGSDHFNTRGGFERSVSYPENHTVNKPTTDGYAPKPLEPDKADSQTISLTSPGRHYISMQDVADFCRMRFKSTEGNQIILDDTNERIYSSTAMGRNWFEFDEGSGKIYFYTSSKLNMHAENDINLYSDENINIVAKKRVNIQSEERAVKIQAKMNVEALSSSGNLKLTASRDIHLKTTAGDQASSVSESASCNSPPYSGNPLGYIRDYEEEAGSGTSKIFINGHDGIEVRADSGSINITASDGIDIRSIGSGIKLTGGSTIDLVAPASINNESATFSIIAGNFATTCGEYGFVASPDDPIITLGTGQPASPAGTADQADEVSGDGIQQKMIVPQHESWTRDEDETNCPTPRNPKYQG
jgi:hypothetical protein